MPIIKKKQPAATCSVGCIIVKWIVSLLLFIAVVLAATGVVQTHMAIDMNGFLTMQFGSSQGSLALIAFSIAILGWVKQMISCMGKCDVCSVK